MYIWEIVDPFRRQHDLRRTHQLNEPPKCARTIDCEYKCRHRENRLNESTKYNVVFFVQIKIGTIHAYVGVKDELQRKGLKYLTNDLYAEEGFTSETIIPKFFWKWNFAKKVFLKWTKFKATKEPSWMRTFLHTAHPTRSHCRQNHLHVVSHV